MAYQNVSTPRFYIDWTGYNKAIGNFYPNSAWDVYGLTAGGAYIPNTNTNGKVWLSSSLYHANFPQGIPMPLPDVSNENSKLFTACLGNNAADVSFEGHPTSTPPGQTTGTGLQVSFSIPDSQGNATKTAYNPTEYMAYATQRLKTALVTNSPGFEEMLEAIKTGNYNTYRETSMDKKTLNTGTKVAKELSKYYNNQ